MLRKKYICLFYIIVIFVFGTRNVFVFKICTCTFIALFYEITNILMLINKQF